MRLACNTRAAYLFIKGKGKSEKGKSGEKFIIRKREKGYKKSSTRYSVEDFYYSSVFVIFLLTRIQPKRTTAFCFFVATAFRAR